LYIPFLEWSLFDNFFYCNFISYLCFFFFLLFILLFYVYIYFFFFFPFEFYYLLILILILFFCLLICNDLLLLYLVIEIISLIFYSLSAIGNNSIRQAEAALKYFILGSVSSIFLLFSICLIYGIFGNLNYNYFIFFLSDYFFFNKFNNLIYFSFLIFLFSFFFKLGLVPFHIWLLDVYVGLNWLLFIFFLIFPKFIYFFFLFKFFFFLNFFLILYKTIIFIICFLSILIGSLGLVTVVDIKRFLVYSSINNFGFIFSCFFNMNFFSIISAIIYLMVYLFLLIFFFCFFFFKYKFDLFYIFEFNKLKNLNIIFLFSFCFLLFSLAGIPPFIGFFIKFNILISFYVYTNSILFLCFIIFLTLINLFGYLRLIAFLFFDVIYYGFVILKFKYLFYFFLLLLNIINLFFIFYYFYFFKLLNYYLYLYFFLC